MLHKYYTSIKTWNILNFNSSHSAQGTFGAWTSHLLFQPSQPQLRRQHRHPLHAATSIHCTAGNYIYIIYIIYIIYKYIWCTIISFPVPAMNIIFLFLNLIVVLYLVPSHFPSCHSCIYAYMFSVSCKVKMHTLLTMFCLNLRLWLENKCLAHK